MKPQHQESSMKARNQAQIAVWLYFGAVCIIIQILLGGITRLSGSGLSITEWQPLIGALPPTSDAAWQLSFQKYQQIAQYHILNKHFTLDDYKSIFFWEWLHRNWARFIGLAFIFPLIYFILTKKITQRLIPPLLLLFALGLLQAVIGWIMVQSGLNKTSTRVDHIRLAIHFIAALLLLCYTLWFAFKLSIMQIKMRHRLKFPALNLALLLLVVIQMTYGAFMAGTSAANAAITWPDMNGSFLPDLGLGGLALDALHSNPLTIQFIHRNLAYLITILTIMLYWRCRSWKINPALSIIRLTPVLLIFTQVILGISTLLHALHIDYNTYALLHQFTGILFTISLLLSLFLNLKRT